MSPLNVTRIKSKNYEQYSVLSIIYAQTSLVYKGRDPYPMCSVYLVISKGEEGTAGKFHLLSSTVSREQQSNSPTFMMLPGERKATWENCSAPAGPPSSLTLKYH